MKSAEILTELRTARPLAADDLRLRVRTIATSAPTPRPSLTSRLRSRRLTLVLLPATAAALALATAGAIGFERSGGTYAAESRDSSVGESADPMAKTDLTQQQTVAPPLAAPAAGAKSTTPGPTTDRAQRFTAQLALEVADNDALSEATQQALQITRSLGGFVVNVTYATTEIGQASMTLRVPTDKAQDAIVRLSSLGTIVSQNIQIDDLQETLDAQDAEILRLQKRIAKLTARLAHPALTEEARLLLQVQLEETRAQLTEIRNARKAVAREASLATIGLTLQTPDAAAVAPVPSRLDRALDEARDVLAWEAAAAIYLGVTLAPFALLAAAFYTVRRTRRRRDDEHLLAAS